MTERERFWAKVRKTPACWEWVGAVCSTGYGRFKTGYGRAGTGNARIEWVHRYAYREFVGPIPAGYHIDHLCRNRRCVRPAHLEAVTPQENVRRTNPGANHKYRDRCWHGHLYTPSTVRYYGPDNRWRWCLTCDRNRKLGLQGALTREQRRVAA